MDVEICLLMRRIEQMKAKLDRACDNTSTQFQPDVPVIISMDSTMHWGGRFFSAMVNELNVEGLQCEPPRVGGGVVTVKRAKDRRGRPGMIKVEVCFIWEKISVLQKKQPLTQNNKGPNT